MKKALSCLIFCLALAALTACAPKGAQWISTLGYELYYDDEQFTAMSDLQVDQFRLTESAGQDVAVYLAVQRLDDYTPQQLLDAMLEVGYELETGEATIGTQDYPVLTASGTDSGSAHVFYFLADGTGTVLLETNCAEGDEQAEADLAAMLETFTLTPQNSTQD